MAFKFPSDEWIKELSRQLNASEAYEKSAKDWEGDFIFVVEPDEAYPQTAYLFLGLYHGKSTDAAMLSSPTEREAEFTISAPFSIWRRSLRGNWTPSRDDDPQDESPGQHDENHALSKAAKEIVSCCALVPTEWPS
jgi:hypothetical protein